MGIGMDHRFRIDHHAHMPRPEHQVTALKRRIVGQTHTKPIALQITICWADDGTRRQRCSDKTRAIDPTDRIPPPRDKARQNASGQ